MSLGVNIIDENDKSTNYILLVKKQLEVNVLALVTISLGLSIVSFKWIKDILA